MTKEAMEKWLEETIESKNSYLKMIERHEKRIETLNERGNLTRGSRANLVNNHQKKIDVLRDKVVDLLDRIYILREMINNK